MSYQSTILADGACGYWRIGEPSGSTATDQAANSNGTYTGVTLAQTGIPGAGGDTAGSFSVGNTSQVSVPVVTANQFGDVFTLEAWIKLASLGTIKAIWTGAAGIRINASNQIEFLHTAVAVLCMSTSAIADTTNFHHVVLTKNGATCHIYLDSVDVTGTFTNFTFPNDLGTYLIGNDGGTAGNHYFNGVLDEVAIYKTALSAATVSNHYSIGSAAASSSATPAAGMGFLRLKGIR